MKAYCANNTKYYKDSNKGEIDHVIRAFAKNVNAFAELTGENFGATFSPHGLNIKDYYNQLLIKAKEQKSNVMQKNSITFIDSCLIFDHDLTVEILNSPDGKERMTETIKEYMEDFKAQYGFEPIGFEFHMDEGTFYKMEDYEKLTTKEKKGMVKVVNDDNGQEGYLKRNLHAQAIFLNYDFDKGKSCLRHMKRKEWGNVQDLMHKHFKKYGYSRGELKKTNSRDHQEKAEYVRGLEKKALALSVIVRDKNEELLDLIDEMDGIAVKSERYDYVRKGIAKTIKTAKARFPKALGKVIKFLGNGEVAAFAKKAYTSIVNAFDYTAEELDPDFKPEQKQEQAPELVHDTPEKVEPQAEQLDLEPDTVEGLAVFIGKQEEELEQRKKKANNRRIHGRKRK